MSKVSAYLFASTLFTIEVLLSTLSLLPTTETQPVTGSMDSVTRARLEMIRGQVPRYLFRAWNNTATPGVPVSGGNVGCNTTQAIIPVAFLKGKGSKSVYHLSRDHFTAMAVGHLTGAHNSTELSSWASSLAFALSYAWRNFCRTGLGNAQDAVHISIIDTKAVQVFYTPSLAFLHAGAEKYDHEYLAHGVITGTAHKAMPLQCFTDVTTIDPFRGYIRSSGEEAVMKIRSASMRRGRQIGDQYGEEFALPMCLAFVCRKRRDVSWFRDGVLDLEVIQDGLQGLSIPEKWLHDRVPTKGASHISGWPDVEQLLRLTNVLAVSARDPVSKLVARRKASLRENVRRSGAIEEVGVQQDQEQEQSQGQVHIRSGSHVTIQAPAECTVLVSKGTKTMGRKRRMDELIGVEIGDRPNKFSKTLATDLNLDSYYDSKKGGGNMMDRKGDLMLL